MKVVALISGGKDSCYNMMECVRMGHSIVGLANLQPVGKDELDSYMYQTVGHEAIQFYADAMDLPLFTREITGESKSTGLNYSKVVGDEVEDLFQLLHEIKSKVEYDAISCGAILSDYQRLRVEEVCGRLGLTCLAYLWRRDQQDLMEEMLENRVQSIIIKTAGIGLGPKHLGQSLGEMKEHLLDLNSKYGSHICGEGGEYETFTLDCPLFKKKIIILRTGSYGLSMQLQQVFYVVYNYCYGRLAWLSSDGKVIPRDESKIVIHSDDDFAPVAYLKLAKLHVESKPFNQPNQLVAGIPTLKSWPQQQCEIKEYEIQLQPRLHWQDEPCHEPSISSKESGHYLALSGIYGFCDGSSRNVKQATTVAMNSLMDELHNKGHCANDVTSVHLYLSDINDFYDINSIYKTYFHHQPPSRVCVAVSMGCVGAKKPILQIDCLSYHNLDESVSGNLHVQSVSHWAPANIGPYSQCFTRNKTHFVAGQIGLVPGSMELIDGCYDQACLAMQHVMSILRVVSPNGTLDEIFQCVCYVTNIEHVNIAKMCWDNQAIETKEIQNLPIYVIVPSLPKSSAIEWQVISSDRYNINDKKEGEQLEILTSTVYTDHKITDNVTIMANLKKGFQILKSKIKDRNLTWKNLLQIRLFHVVTHLPNHADFYKEAWGEGEPPSLTPVPVESIFTHVNNPMQIMFHFICLVNFGLD